MTDTGNDRETSKEQRRRNGRNSLFTEGGVEDRRRITNMTDEEQRLGRRPGLERWK